MNPIRWVHGLLMARNFSSAGATVAMYVLGTALLLALGAATSCTVSHFRGKAKQAAVNTSQAEAAAGAGETAITITRETGALHTETDTIIKDGTNAIRTAPDGASAALAAQCANCLLRLYRDARQCAELRASGQCKRAPRPD